MMYNPKIFAQVEHSPLNEGDDYDVIVIKGIDPATETGRIFVDLERLGYRVHSIRNGMITATQRAAPVFYVELFKSPYNETILGMKRVANQNVYIQRYQNPQQARPTIPQGHDHPSVSRPQNQEEVPSLPMCAWCRGTHQTSVCTIGEDYPPDGCECGGWHPSYHKCCNDYRKRVIDFMDKIRKSSNVTEINMPTKDLIEKVHEEKKKKDQPLDSEMEKKVISTISFTHDTFCLDYLEKNLKFTLDHYLSMHCLLRKRLLSIDFEGDTSHEKDTEESDSDFEYDEYDYRTFCHRNIKKEV